MTPVPTIANNDDNIIYRDGTEEEEEEEDVMEEEEEAGAQQRVLSLRTNQLMDSFREYVSGLGNDGSIIPSTRMMTIASDNNNNSRGSNAPATSSTDDDHDVEKSGTIIGGGGEGAVVTLLKGGEAGGNAPPVLVQGELDWYGKGGLRDFSILEEDGLNYDDLDAEAPTTANGGWGRSAFSSSSSQRSGRNYNRSNRKRYKHALFQSKRFKRGLLMIALSITIIAITVSVAKIKKERNLPNWNEQLNEMKMKEEEEKNLQMEQQQPFNTDESDASDIISDALSQSQPSSGSTQENNDNVAFDIISDVLAHAINVTQSDSYDSNEDHYLEMAYKYKPIWISRNTTNYQGSTYAAAMVYCSQQNPTMFVCPYEAYCPGGANKAPAGGFKGTENDPIQWAPILDHDNAWVQVSPNNGNECVLYDLMYDEPPAWGTIDYMNKEQTEYVMCCPANTFEVNAEITANYEMGIEEASSTESESSSSQSTSFPHPSEEVIALEYGNAEKFQPIWYNRKSGWGGQTYAEALKFCVNVRSGAEEEDDGTTTTYYEGMVCPYEAYCPSGPLGLPYGGTEEETIPTNDTPSSSSSPVLQWAAMSDFENDWVQVSPGENMCMPYSSIYMDVPDWGITAENEGGTRFLMCCRKIRSDSSSNSGTEQIVDVPTPSTPAPSSSAGQENGEPTSQALMTQELGWIYNQVGDKYEMMAFGRFQGWEGSNFTDAVTFCSSTLDASYEPCAFEALCPNGFIVDPSLDDETTQNDIWAPNAVDSWYKLLETGHCVEETSLPVSVDVNRYALCCAQPAVVPVVPTSDTAPAPTLPPISSATDAQVVSDGDYDTLYKDVHELYNPEVHNRSSGWLGQNYTAAIEFCASMQSKMPCPYAAICPMGSSGSPIVGKKDGSGARWAPIIDSPNGWVNIGQKNTCVKYNDMNPHPPLWGLSGENSEAMTQYIVCCDEPMDDGLIVAADEGGMKVASTASEEIILDTMHPAWYGRKHGYHGTTHEEAELFCKSVGDMHLCPQQAYCPSGNHAVNPLFLQMAAFNGEQWAPVSDYDNEDVDLGNDWIMVGTQNSNQTSTCLPYDVLNDGNYPLWAVDGTLTELKQNILCCSKQEALSVEDSTTAKFNSIWLDESHGWSGGSYQDAEAFCEGLGGKHVCPYSAYCPHGPGMNPKGGHSADFTSEGEQWAPVSGKNNAWVMIGRKYDNSATTCLTHEQLEGGDPDWGLTTDNAGAKYHIQCCSF